MFSTKLSRVAHRATTTPAISNPTSTAAHRTTQCLANRPSHQRRPSSSKASCPPDSSKPAPAAKATTTEEATQAPASAPAQQPRRAKRASRLGRLHASLGERMSKSREQVDHFAGLPAVPGLQHLNEKDLRLSNFFSIHRPLSVTTTIPPPSSTEAFNNLFETQHQRDPWENGNSAERRPEDVIYTLHNTIESLENGANNAQDEGVRWEVIQESQTHSGEGIKHLDGAPRLKSLDELVAQFRPFGAPPPPQPFPEEQQNTSSSESSKKRATTKQARSSRQPQQKSYQTTITFTDITTADGTRTLKPHVSPLVRVPDASTTHLSSPNSYQEPQPQQQPRIRQPFLERMRRRQQLYLQNQHTRVLERMGEQRSIRRAPSASGKRKMLLISVKRQRKLKMKKHKYKKLMKRTRNLRRRLDRT